MSKSIHIELLENQAAVELEIGRGINVSRYHLFQHHVHQLKARGNWKFSIDINLGMQHA